MPPEREVDILGDAIAATDKEIFDAANDIEESVLDETGDRSREAMGGGLEGQDEGDGEVEADADADKGAGDGDDAGADDKDAEGDGKGEQPRAKDGTFAAKDDKADKDGADKGTKPDPKDAGKTPAAAGEGEDKPSGKVPPGRLREETAARQAAETRATAAEAAAKAATDAVAALNARLDTILSRPAPAATPAQPAKTEPKKVEVPDVLENPAAFAEYLTQQFTGQLTTFRQDLARDRVEDSMHAAHKQHGETFEQAYQAVTALNKQNPVDRATVQSIWGSRDPGSALMDWHRQQLTLREVGADPSKYREKVASEVRTQLMQDPEFRKQLIADLRTEASQGGDGGKPRNVIRGPKSLNGAAGGSARDVDPTLTDDSDRETFASAFRE